MNKKKYDVKVFFVIMVLVLTVRASLLVQVLGRVQYFYSTVLHGTVQGQESNGGNHRKCQSCKREEISDRGQTRLP